MEAATKNYNENKTTMGTPPKQQHQTPHGDGGTQPQMEDHRAPAGELDFTTVGRQTTPATHLRFGTPEPPTMPLKTRSGPAAVNLPNIEALHNNFVPLGLNGNVSEGKDNEVMSSSILRGGSSSATSNSRGNRGRETIPLTLEILQLLDKLERDKGRHA